MEGMVINMAHPEHEEHLEQEMEEMIAYKELGPEHVRFFSMGDGFLSLEIDGITYNKVELIRLLPFRMPDEYISCLEHGKEIGIIRRITDFSEEQQEILRSQLKFRYYMPEVEKIISIKEKMWFLFIKAVVNGKEKELCMRDLTNSIKFYNESDVVLTDVEENRYLIKQFRSLPKKQLQKLEMYL